MPHIYKRKTDRGSDEALLSRAAEAVRQGSSVRAAAKDYQVDRMALKRYMDKRTNDPQGEVGYNNCKLQNMVFRPEMESDLADHIKSLAACYHGLSKDKCKSLAYEFAVSNDVAVPDSWKKNKKAGQSFWLGFKDRHNLSIRSPEATSLARATAFNRHTVSLFYSNLASVMDLHKFEAKDIYNLDETGCHTVQKPGTIVAEKGMKQVGSVTSAERGELVTVINAINAAGGVLPPFLICPRVNFRSHFLRGAPVGSDGAATRSGWVNEETFPKYLDHFVKQTRSTPDHKVLLILDNHEAHISLEAVDKAKANGIVLLTIPPHTSHRLQPLDKAVYGPYKRAYSRAMDEWMRSNPGKTVTIYDIPQLVNEAQVSACVPRNILAGFQSTGIQPFNSEIFTDTDYAPAAVTDREYQAHADHSGNADTPTAGPSTNQETPTAGPSTNQETPTAGPSTNQDTSTAGPSTNPDTPTAGPSTNQDTPTTGPSTNQDTPTAGPSKNPDAPTAGPSRNPDTPTAGISENPITTAASCSTTCDAGPSTSYVSPKDIQPLPKAAPRKKKFSRKRGCTKILTDTPCRDEIAAAKVAREKKNGAKKLPDAAKKSLFPQTTKRIRSKVTHCDDISSSSDSESEMEIDYDDSEDSGDEDHDVIEGDFVIVKVPGKKSRIFHYVARVDVFKGDEFEGVFLRRVLRVNDRPTFILDAEDEALWFKSDIVKKLPIPTIVGTSRRAQFQFRCNLNRWNLK